MFRPFAILALTLTGSAVAAEPARLDDEAIKATVAGAKLEFDSPLGITVPVEFGHDGLVSGETMALAAVLGAAKDRGRWWVADGKLCSKWFRWFDAEQRCAVVSRDGDRMFFNADDGKNGSATIIVYATPARKRPAPAFVAATATPAPVTHATAPMAEPPKATALNSLANLAVSPAQAAEAPAAVEPARTPLEAVTRATSKAKPKAAEKVRGGKAAAAAKTQTAAGGKSAGKADAKMQRTGATKITAWPGESVQFYRVARVEEDDFLNVREGPSEEHDTIAELPPDERNVAITGPCEADWCPIKHGSTVGWVNRYYLAEEPKRSAAAKPQQ